MNEFHSGMILLLEQLENISQTQLAAAAGTTQARISKIVHRQVEFSEELAKKISLEEDYPTSFFTDTPDLLPIKDLTYRHTSKVPARELNAIAAEFTLLYGTVQQLAQAVHMEDHTGWIDKVAPKKERIDNKDIENIANHARFELRLPPSGSIGNVTRSIEKSGIVVAPLKNLSSDSSTHLSSDGVTYPVKSGLMPVIGYSPNPESGDRERFTKAHELGHMILHRYRRPETYRDMESEAHRFAGAFLMPLSDANQIMNPTTMLSDFARLKSTWGMSIAAMISRAHNGGIISYDRYRSLFMQLSVRGWRKQEPVHVGREKPVLLAQLLEQTYGNHEGLVDALQIERNLKRPFRYIDFWAEGVREQGTELGFCATRF